MKVQMGEANREHRAQGRLAEELGAPGRGGDLELHRAEGSREHPSTAKLFSPSFPAFVPYLSWW